ncbi:MAG: ABC transporter ATP-binding protein [Mycobacteriales bacterium]|nr:MAG: ABC transporter ATP-binding protein [Pseudonocardiales bacterium]
MTTPTPDTSERPSAQADPAAADRPALVIDGVTKVLGGRTIIDDLDLSIGAGELVCLLGPSGCGKTTTLRMIGGFIRPDHGQIRIAGKDVTPSPPERRPTAMVFQNYALWPHMTVFKNVAFGLKLRKLPKAEIEQRVEQALSLVNLTHHTQSHPAQISGGEQQRVALARALVLEPEVLLLDEPLSNLDAKLRVRVREDIREIQQRVGITTVFVTHDQDEALAISDRIAVMSKGRIEQYADAGTLYSMPQTRFVADFVGAMNTFDGVPGIGSVTVDGKPIPATMVTDTASEPAQLCVRPEDVRISSDGDGPLASVLREMPRGHYKEIVLAIGETEVRAFVAADFTGEQAHVVFSRVLVYRDGVLIDTRPGADSARRR